MLKMSGIVSLLSLSAAPSGCSVFTDVDGLQASWQPDGSSDVSPHEAPSDSRPPLDQAASREDMLPHLPQDSGGAEDERSPEVGISPEDAAGAVDVSTEDVGPGQDASTDDARPGQDASTEDVPALPDAADTPDATGSSDGGDGLADAGGADASDISDAAGDASPDALMMCPSSPSRSTTLYLESGTSTNTECGYARASLPRLIAAVDPALFAASAACGGCLRIETPAGVVETVVVESGPAKTAANTISVAVNRAAMTVLAPDGSTSVDQGVTARFVPCTLPPDAGMVFQLQEGSNTSYAAVLVQNHRYRIATVEYRIRDAYRRLTRASYNYWVANNGMGTGPFTLRITDVHGHVVEQAGIPLKPGVPFRGAAQFPPCAAD
ncbi:MAG TPA: expansin EXLX1 family cellulose-binding protein [Polyangia bacterium]|nr:expansin EXLX1 family cellulose-binding protein [Polyangia bacterium]